MLQLLAPFLPQMYLFLTKVSSRHLTSGSTAWQRKKRLISCQVCLQKCDYKLLVCRYSCTSRAAELFLPWEGETCWDWVRSTEQGKSHSCCNKVGQVLLWTRLLPCTNHCTKHSLAVSITNHLDFRDTWGRELPTDPQTPTVFYCGVFSEPSKKKNQTATNTNIYPE